MIKSPASRVRLMRLNFGRGSASLFANKVVPVGFYKSAAHNNKAIRVVNGIGGVAGGVNNFTTVMAQSNVGNTTLDISKMASHLHAYSMSGTWPWFAGATAVRIAGLGGFTGGDVAHTHSIVMDISYLDMVNGIKM